MAKRFDDRDLDIFRIVDKRLKRAFPSFWSDKVGEPKVNDVLITNVTNITQLQTNLDNLNTVVLPGLEDRLDDNEAAINTLNTVTLPALQDELDDLEDQIASGLGVEIVDTLPTTDNFEGRVVFLTTDDKLYRYTGAEWISAVAATDITGQLTDAQLEAIAAAKLTGQITEVQISDNAISTPKLQAGAITTAKIEAGAILAGNIATGAITTEKIEAGAITANELATNSVTANAILAGTITAAKIGAGQILADNIGAGAVTTLKLAAGAVTANEIAADTITANKLDVASIAASEAFFDAVIANSAFFDELTTNQVFVDQIFGNDLSLTGQLNVGTAPTFVVIDPDGTLPASVSTKESTTATDEVAYSATDREIFLIDFSATDFDNTLSIEVQYSVRSWSSGSAGGEVIFEGRRDGEGWEVIKSVPFSMGSDTTSLFSQVLSSVGFDDFRMYLDVTSGEVRVRNYDASAGVTAYQYNPYTLITSAGIFTRVTPATTTDLIVTLGSGIVSGGSGGSGGTDVITGLTATADRYFRSDGAGNVIERTAALFKADLDLEIGTDVQAYNANLTTYASNFLTAGELGQLQNINSVTISNTQWGYVGALNQGLTSSSSPTFAGLTLSGALGGTSATFSSTVIAANPTLGTHLMPRAYADSRYSFDIDSVDQPGVQAFNPYEDTLKFQGLGAAGVAVTTDGSGNPIVQITVAAAPSDQYVQSGTYVDGEYESSGIDPHIQLNYSTGGSMFIDMEPMITHLNTLYNNYSHPTGFSNQPGTALTGANVISRITVNSEGHVTGVSTRALTPANIGASADSHTHAFSVITGTIDLTQMPSIPNSKLLNSSISDIQLGDDLQPLSAGTGITMSNYNGFEARSIVVTNYANLVTGYDRSVTALNRSITAAGNLSISRQTAASVSTVLKSIGVGDARTTADFPNSDTTTGYMPLPNESLFTKGVVPIFSTDWPGASWGGILTVKGWSGDYGAWQLAGSAALNSTESAWHLRVGSAATWSSWREVIISGVAQTIAGQKTFTSDIIATNVILS